jgi:integrase
VIDGRHVLIEAFFELSEEALAVAFAHLREHPAAPVSHQKRKGFKKCIGTYQSPDGTLRPKVFWLGHFKRQAELSAAVLKAVLHARLRDGKPNWDADALANASLVLSMMRQAREDTIKAAHAVLRDLEAAPYVPALTSAPPPAPAPAALASTTAQGRSDDRMLHAAMDAWIAGIGERYRSGDVSDDYVSRAKCTVRNLKIAMSDGPLRATDTSRLEGCRLWYQRALALPKGQKGRKAWNTVKTEMNQARTMFQWFADREWWDEPRKWKKSLTPARTAQCDDEREDRGDDPKVYTVDELAKLYAKANDNQKLYLLCGLNFAWGQKETAMCRKRHWHVEGEGVMVKRRRHKRPRNAEAVYAEWHAWPETWALAKARMKVTPDDPTINPKGLAFLTEDGRPLVRREFYKLDAINDAFSRLCKTAEVENRGFYALRRTAIDMIEDIAGESVAQMMGSHQPRSITHRHYARRKWNKLHEAMRVMRERLKPMFDAKSEATAGGTSDGMPTRSCVNSREL